MSYNLSIPDDLAGVLTGVASNLGMSMPDYALQVLSSVNQPTSSIKTGAELVAYWESAGVIGSRPDITDSQAYARKLREQAQRREN
jgi:hypothetical protein